VQQRREENDIGPEVTLRIDGLGLRTLRQQTAVAPSRGVGRESAFH
jgi:hypothetical protein